LGITPIQLSLAFVLNYDFPVAAIIGSENADEMLSSIAATAVKLTDEQMKWLDLQTN
jgi:aryl-alcohol dehydrogenase-like predicted oxidoreductase